MIKIDPLFHLNNFSGAYILNIHGKVGTVTLKRARRRIQHVDRRHRF